MADDGDRGTRSATKANDITEAQGTSIPVRDSRLGESSSSATPTESEGEAQQRQLKTAAELAEMIEFDLARHPDCPKAGFRVTVYGWPYWRTMLTITPAAGRVRNLKNGETLPVSSLSGFASGTIWLGTSEATTQLLFCDKNPALTFS